MRSRALADNESEEVLVTLTKKMMVRNVIIVGIFTGIVFSCGLWLAYHRVLESIYS